MPDNVRMHEKEIMRKFGNNLRAERARLGLSQEKLAELAGLSCFTHIGKIERGEINAKLTTIVKLLKALNLPFDELLK
ncbi:MAG: helix-turn-helix transcriptional regulator [Candidatus Gastranaerophilales bacterium]|nr:helix-turn-helix transcriptional regulator [Candidatus Gastranaerophilales bacterium]